jgi:hypothetical protein
MAVLGVGVDLAKPRLRLSSLPLGGRNRRERG